MSRGSVRRRGDSWTAVVDVGVDPATGRRRQQRQTFSRKKDADDWVRTTIDNVAAGTFTKPLRTGLGVWLVEQWLPVLRQEVRPTTYALHEINVTRYIVPRIGGVHLAGVTTADLKQLYAELRAEGGRGGRGLAPKTVKNIHGTLRRALRDAHAWGLIRKNPAENAAPVTPRSVDVLSVWEPDELGRFVDHARADRLAAAWTLFATTGMRREEVLGLRWAAVDLDAGTVTVRQVLVSVNARPVLEEATKSGPSARRIALDPVTVRALRDHRRAQAEERLAVGEAWQDHGLVFCREDGVPMRPETVSRRFLRLSQAAGLPRITLHDVRHSYATAALKAGVPVKVVSERLGHADPAVTLRVYAHALPGDDREAAHTAAAAILGKLP